MAHNPIVDVRAWLIAGPQSVTTEIFLGALPPDDDTVIGLYESGGSPPEIAMGGVVIERKVSVQVRVRAARDGYAGAATVVQQVYDLLKFQQNVTMNGEVYDKVVSIQEPFALEPDSSERPLFVFNIEMWYADD